MCGGSMTGLDNGGNIHNVRTAHSAANGVHGNHLAVAAPAWMQIAARGPVIARCMQERGRGNLIVHFRLVVPASLTPEQEQALRAYAAAGGEKIEVPEKRGFFGRRKKN